MALLAASILQKDLYGSKIQTQGLTREGDCRVSDYSCGLRWKGDFLCEADLTGFSV